MKFLSVTSGLFTLVILLLASCKKDTDTTTANPPSKFANSPTCAYYHTAIGSKQLITFMDLRSTNVSEKKYFTVELKFIGTKDSFEVVTSPRSIDSLGKGFPAEITEYPGFGFPNQWINPQYMLKTSFGTYYKDTIPRNPASNIYYLYQYFTSGGLQGEWPQSNIDYLNEPTGINGDVIRHTRTIFYFKKGYCLDATNIEPNAAPKNLNSFYRGSPNIYDWQNVNAVIGIGGSLLPNTRTVNMYFLDFKNWRYFSWIQHPDVTTGTALLATKFTGYESLDKFIKWPEGWGKP
jgi:hypothetical protein